MELCAELYHVHNCTVCVKTLLHDKYKHGEDANLLPYVLDGCTVNTDNLDFFICATNAHKLSCVSCTVLNLHGAQYTRTTGLNIIRSHKTENHNNDICD